MTEAIYTLAKASRHQMVLRVECRSCGKLRYFETMKLLTVFGAARDPLSIRFGCSECRERCRPVMLPGRDVDLSTVTLLRAVVRGGRREWVEEAPKDN